nr:MAG TPA: hypothetical protein [Caudoviricetes sp.]
MGCASPPPRLPDGPARRVSRHPLPGPLGLHPYVCRHTVEA